MIKAVTIIGARPQIIKAAALSRAIRHHFSGSIMETIIHTGQHYDHNMSDIFIKELDVPQPDYNLGIGSDSHGAQTAKMIAGIEEILLKEKPDLCILFGDTNSTLAGAVAATKIHIPVAHIEAGLRSFDKTMPEELNRIACDHFSSFLFAPTETAVSNLQNEGFQINNSGPFHINNPIIIRSGDIMFDNTLHFASLAERKTDIIDTLQLHQKKYILCTIHRPHNTDDMIRLKSIFSAIQELASQTDMQFIIPLHPRTVNIINSMQDDELTNMLNNKAKNVKVIAPVSFLEMTALEMHSQIIITDSGGVQKEAYFLNKPCVILRNETEWVEIITNHAGELTDTDSVKIKQAVHRFIQMPPVDFPNVFGNGLAAETICSSLIEYL